MTICSSFPPLETLGEPDELSTHSPERRSCFLTDTALVNQSLPARTRYPFTFLNWIQHINLHARNKSSTLRMHLICSEYCAQTYSAQYLQRWKNPRSFRNCWLWQTHSSLAKFNWSKWWQQRLDPLQPKKGPFWYCFGNKVPDSSALTCQPVWRAWEQPWRHWYHTADCLHGSQKLCPYCCPWWDPG